MQSNHHQWDLFWKREREANVTTKSHFPMPILLTIDRNKIPYIKSSAYEETYYRLLKYANCKMVYLKDLSNVDIKMKYGVNYFNEIINYEETFYHFMNELMQYAVLLKEGNDFLKSIETLEYAYSFDYRSHKMKSALLEIQDALLGASLSIACQKDLQKRIQTMLN